MKNNETTSNESAATRKAISTAAAAMGRRRWAGIQPAERTAIMTEIGSRGGRPRTSAPRCPCGNMTLKLARTRGITARGHQPGCAFHKAPAPAQARRRA